MKFISTETVDNNKLKFSAERFDRDLAISATKEEDGIYSIAYKPNVAGNPVRLPFKLSSLTICVRITSTNVYASAIGEFINDEDYALYEEYSTDGAIEFDVMLNDEEKIEILVYILSVLS